MGERVSDAMKKTVLLMLVCGAVLGLAPSARGQNALDRKLEKPNRGLERNTARYPQTQQPRGGRDFAAEVRFRNAIVTGNAPGGLSFRGYAGYTDTRDFSGRTGSDDLFAFRRDSYFSGLSGAGIRGTEALQYQFSMSTGAQGGRELAGGLEMSSTNTARTTLARDTTSRDTRNDWIRSSSTYTASRGLRPTDLGNRRVSDTESEQVTASPLLGIKSKKIRPANPLAVDDSIRRTPVVSSVKPVVAPVIPNPFSAPTVPVERPTDPEKGPVVNSMGDRIRERLEAWNKANDAAKTTPEPKTEDPTRWSRRMEGVRRHLLISPKKGAATAEESGETFDIESLRMLRESSLKIETYVTVPPGVSIGDAYAKSMDAAQSSLAQGDFFDAESRFSRALTASPGDLGAMAGRLHAQLGAGMLLSASVNLRHLLTIAPEVSTANFSPSMIPPARALKDLAAVLRDRLGQNPEADAIARTMSEAEIGLLLAYVGRLTADEALIRQGLAAIKPGSAAAELDEQNRRLSVFLRVVWLGETPPQTPAEAHPPAKAPDVHAEPTK